MRCALDPHAVGILVGGDGVLELARISDHLARRADAIVEAGQRRAALGGREVRGRGRLELLRRAAAVEDAAGRLARRQVLQILLLDLLRDCIHLIALLFQALVELLQLFLHGLRFFALRIRKQARQQCSNYALSAANGARQADTRRRRT